MLKKIDTKLQQLNVASNNEYNSEKELLKLNFKSGSSAYINSSTAMFLAPAVFPSLFKLVKNILYFAVSLTANLLTLGLNKNLREFCVNKLFSLGLNICNTALSIILPLARLPQTLIYGYSMKGEKQSDKNKTLAYEEAFRFFNTWFKPQGTPISVNNSAAPINDVDKAVYNALSCSN